MANPKGNEATLKKYEGTWRHGSTRTIRVPIVLADRVLGYARQLDQSTNGEPDRHYNRDLLENLAQVINNLEEVYKVPRNNFSKEKKALLRKTIDELIHLTQVNK